MSSQKGSYFQSRIEAKISATLKPGTRRKQHTSKRGYQKHLIFHQFEGTVLFFFRVATQYPLQNFLTFTDFTLFFDRFPDPFRRPILAFFIHQQFENFVQIVMIADLIFKEKSQTISIRKGMCLNIGDRPFTKAHLSSRCWHYEMFHALTPTLHPG